MTLSAKEVEFILHQKSNSVKHFKSVKGALFYKNSNSITDYS